MKLRYTVTVVTELDVDPSTYEGEVVDVTDPFEVAAYEQEMGNADIGFLIDEGETTVRVDPVA